MAGSVPVAMVLARSYGPSTTVFLLILITFISAGLVFPLAGFYRGDTRSTSLYDVIVISRGAALAILIAELAAKLLPIAADVPLTTYVVQFLIAVPALGALRVVARRRELMRKRTAVLSDPDERIPALLVGTGANCDLFIRSLRQPDARYCPVGIIDDVRGTLGLYYHNVKILGSLRDSEVAIAAIEQAEIEPKQLLLTEPMTQFDGEGIRNLLTWARHKNISVARLPGLGEQDFGTGEAGGSKLRNVNPEDILNRPQMAIERSLLRQLFAGRRVLVTGAGGSIGSELTRQIASFEPAQLVLIENTELNAYSIDMDLGRHFPEVPRAVLMANIRDADRVSSIFETYRPELVFHAAALKHVPMVELNCCEGVLTNIIGTRNIADAARDVGAIAMVQVSTDKAVNATSVMGATKRVAEFYVQAQDRITSEIEDITRFFSVRFGNVLGSSGSLIPLFQRQISEGGPLTVTDERMERYFMTIREAVELTLVAAAGGLARQSKQGEIFVLDMGEPVKIIDLAERMIRLAGLVPHEDIGIKVVGTRPGEKLFEELFDKAERHRESGIPGVRSALPDGVPIAQLRAAIRRLERAARDGNEAVVREQLRYLVPGYGTPPLKPIPAKDLDATIANPAARALAPTRPPQVSRGGVGQRAWVGE